MSKFEFSCPQCKQILEATDDMSGQLVDCPSCNEPIEVPFPKRPQQRLKTKTNTQHSKPNSSTSQLSNNMVFCRGCGKKIHETAPMCPHCGALTNSEATEQNICKYKSYNDVPFYRRNGYAILFYFICSPALLIILLTGNVYYKHNGQIKPYKMVARIFIILLCIFNSLYSMYVIAAATL